MPAADYKASIKAIEKAIQDISFDANIYDKLGIKDYAYGEECSKKRKKLRAELERLRTDEVKGVYNVTVTPNSRADAQRRNPARQNAHSPKTEKQLTFDFDQQ